MRIAARVYDEVGPVTVRLRRLPAKKVTVKLDEQTLRVRTRDNTMNSRPSLLRNVKHSGCAILLVLIALCATSLSHPPIPPTGTFFCACCADPGTWDLETRKIDDWEMKELNRLRPDGVALFYMTERWPDDLLGISPPDLDEELVTSLVREQHSWKLFLKTKGGRTGSLILALSGTALFFNADIGEGPRPEHRSPISIHKEIRLEGPIRGTGIFAKGLATRTKYRLVLQGGGNSCLTAEDFYRWNLRVTGPRARYTIYGYFAKPSPVIDR